MYENFDLKELINQVCIGFARLEPFTIFVAFWLVRWVYLITFSSILTIF